MIPRKAFVCPPDVIEEIISILEDEYKKHDSAFWDRGVTLPSLFQYFIGIEGMELSCGERPLQEHLSPFFEGTVDCRPYPVEATSSSQMCSVTPVYQHFRRAKS